MLNELLMIFLGLIVGSITGLIPGLHINNVCTIIIGASSFLLQHFSGLELSIFITSTAITHTFLDSIPSIFLGAPSSDSDALVVLPGHKMLLQGRGKEAVILTVIGSLFSLVLSVALLPFLIILFRTIYPFVKDWTGLILLVASILIIFRGNNRMMSLLFFLFSGILGVVGFEKLDSDALMPMLSGLFGVSILLLSINGNAAIPEQRNGTRIRISKKHMMKGVGGATFASAIAAFLPGFGNAQAAILAQSVIGRMSTEGTLMLLGGINTASMAISVATLLAIDKARNGAMTTINELVGINADIAFNIIGAALVAGGIAVWLAKKYSEKFSMIIRKIDYKKLITSIIVLIIATALFSSGAKGLLLLMTATAIGISASLLNVAKNNLMGCLILPVVLYFFGIA
ncbi:MAG: putative rane protein [Candidatus Woesearchaeota archaeon]|nr:putative rane protein [Candidatus Woesearchaeota archaeon]